MQNRNNEKFLNAHSSTKTYQIIDGATTIMGIVGKEVKLPDGRSMLEIIKDLKDPQVYLVEYDRKLIKERDRYVELTTDHRGSMVEFKDLKTMLKEIDLQQREPNANLKTQQRTLERQKDLGGIER